MAEHGNNGMDRSNALLSTLRKKLGKEGFVSLLQRLQSGSSLENEYMTHIPLEERSKGLDVVIDPHRRVHARHSRSPRDTRGRNKA